VMKGVLRGGWIENLDEALRRRMGRDFVGG
jgi:hypothetical protein